MMSEGDKDVCEREREREKGRWSHFLRLSQRKKWVLDSLAATSLCTSPIMGLHFSDKLLLAFAAPDLALLGLNGALEFRRRGGGD